MVEHLLMEQWVIGSIPHGGPIELFVKRLFSVWLYGFNLCNDHLDK